MAGEEAIKEFPDVNHKLAAPKKLSAFEKERQAADEKRRRAEAEDAAALKAFQDSFGGDGDDPLAAAVRARGPPAGPRGGGGGGGGGYGGPDRGSGMPPMGPRSGPGSLGVGQGMAPPSLKRKRALDEMREAQEARREQAMLGDESARGHGSLAHSVQEVDHEDEAPRPTVRLANLPPDITNEKVEALLKGYLKVHSVNIVPPTGAGDLAKLSLTAVASLAAETSTSQIDAAVSVLKDRYLGGGFYLSISRHLSSSALHPSMTGSSTSTSIEPFGAEKPKEPPRGSMRNAPPPSDRRGFAPPDQFDHPSRGAYGTPARPEAVVNVNVPLDITTIRAIHVLVERLMTESDPQRAMKTEALLMAMPDVQHDERFAFLYNSRSPAGLYYRYLLWGPDDPSERNRHAKGLERIHDDTVMEWAPPQSQVPFLDLTSLADVVTDIDYVSSDEESDNEGGERRFYDNRDADGPFESNKKEHLNPVKRARLVHLLARLPTSNARLRKGDIARVTNFAINHAGQGAEEIVDLLLLNVEKPFCCSLAAKYEAASDSQDSEESDYEPDDRLPTLGGGIGSPGTNAQPHRDNSSKPANDPSREKEKDSTDDPSTAKLIALYTISDILSASSTAGARNAWKYRQLIETGFKAHKTFERLGALEKSLGWGLLRAEQWKRRVGGILGIWEGWSVFGGEVHGGVEEGERGQEEGWKGRFKRIGGEGASGGASPATPAVQAVESVDGAPMAEDVDGAPMNDDIDGAPMEDVDGQAMDEDVDGAPMEELESAPINHQSTADEATVTVPPAATAVTPDTPATATAASVPKPSGPKRRMRAEDMFASDED
ncbi:hypothetical protein LTR91_018293 [Friedmanniomyces endolithicus]|uniref:CID domain-containing protein n=1 Tax=Friedmanniomyces endolithicus TaxID=329885 RepID=A0AAN6HE21_9PEZI|nr:hypothetical protein LTR91_018293 [Friedmanniomyces endolithicus]